jgi:CheY-like chemotaxis protein
MTQPFSILWVDDYPSNNAFLIEQFQKDGIEVKLALSTNEGLKELLGESFDMIITDLGRKENGRDNPFAGLEFIKQVRDKNNNAPILVYAGDRGMQNQSKLLKAGATKVTQSPVEVQSFINSLRRKLT